MADSRAKAPGEPPPGDAGGARFKNVVGGSEAAAAHKRPRESEGEDSFSLELPDYVQARHLPSWLKVGGRGPSPRSSVPHAAVHVGDDEELTPRRVDELHHIQWFAWKDHKDYAKILEPAPLLLNSRFVSLNPNNAAITVGLTTEALYRTRAPPLTVANTFLYGLYLLREEPKHLSTPIHFCKAALAECMEAWAVEACGPASCEQAMARLRGLCRTFPHSGLPNVLGRRVKARAEELLHAGQFSAAQELLAGLLGNAEGEEQDEARAWVLLPHVWDDNLYWRLRLLSLLAAYRSGGGETHGGCRVRVSALVFTRSQGRLPRRLDCDEDSSQWPECGQELSREQVSALLSALRSSFSVFSSTYLALTGGLVQWELDLDEARDVLWGSTLQARRAKRERTGPTNPDRMIAQPDVERCAELSELLGQERARQSQAVLLVWPGLRPPSDYMCTCGGVAPRGPGGRYVYMSDGTMMDHEPRWSPEWWHHETFHVIEHLFPEAPFSKLSEEVGHPCFLRDRWPEGYRGHGEGDYYYWSYRLHCLPAKPSLPERLGRTPGEAKVLSVEVCASADMGRIVSRLAKEGDAVELLGIGTLALCLNDAGKWLVLRGEGATGSLAVWRHARSLKLVVTALPGGGEGGQSSEELRQHRQVLRDDPASDGESDGDDDDEGSQAAASMRLSPPPSALDPWTSVLSPRSSFSLADVLAWLEVRIREDCLPGWRCCTFRGTGPYWVRQQWYKCLTCSEAGRADNGAGFCAVCARCCHAGHELVEQELSPFYCDCPAGGIPCVKNGEASP